MKKKAKLEPICTILLLLAYDNKKICCEVFFIYLYKYAIIGGDVRQKLILEELSKHFNCTHFGVVDGEALPNVAQTLELAIRNAESIILPIPMHRGNNLNIHSETAYHMKELISYMKKGQTVFAGCISREFRELLEHKGVQYFDFMEQTEISIYNSIATAEGLIAEMILASPENLHGNKVLILGYGTCAKTIASKLKGLHVNTCVCARKKSALMEACAMGHEIENISHLSEIISHYSIIINTIPSQILQGEILEKINAKSSIFEIASYPYGIDIEAANKYSFNVNLCMSLPAKYAPVSSANILTQFILKTSAQVSRRIHAATLPKQDTANSNDGGML